MSKNNLTNSVRYPSQQLPSKSSFPVDPLRSSNGLDFGHVSKPDSNDRDNLNELFSKNMQNNPSMGLYYDKGSSNADFYFGSHPNQSFALDSNLLYNLAGHPHQPNPNQANAEHPSMFQAHKNSMFPSHVPNAGNFEDLMKPSNPYEAMYFNQFGLPDPNMFAPMMPENMGLFENQFFFPGMNQDMGQGDPGNFPYQNPLLFNNFYGGDFNYQNLLLQNFQNLPFEDIYNLQMQGRLPPNGMPGNMENSRSMPGIIPQATHKEKQDQMEKAANPMTRGLPVEMNAHQQYIQQQQQYFQQQYLQQQKMMNNAKHFEQAQNESHQPQNLNQAALSQQKESLRVNAQIHGQKKPTDEAQTINNQIKNNEKNFQQNLQNKNEKKQITQTNQAIKLPEEKGNKLQAQINNQEDLTRSFDPLKAGLDPTYISGQFGDFEKYITNGFFDQMAFTQDVKNATLGSLGLGGDSIGPFSFDIQQMKIKEKNKYERQLKIERYKAKKRNWKKSVAYECRRRVANTRLRIKGRFISKKDSEKICEFVGKKDEAFNDKKNLKLEFIKAKFENTSEDLIEGLSAKPNVAKKFLLNKIDETLHHKRDFGNLEIESERVKGLLSASKKIFKVKKRQEEEMLHDLSSTPTSAGMNKPQLEEKSLNKQQEKQDFGFEFSAPPGFGEVGFERFSNIPKEMLETMMYNMHGMMNPHYMGSFGSQNLSVDSINREKQGN